jgi:hypothetical protein
MRALMAGSAGAARALWNKSSALVFPPCIRSRNRDLQAIDDLASLRAYISVDDPAAAKRIALHIIHSVVFRSGRDFVGLSLQRSASPPLITVGPLPSGAYRKPSGAQNKPHLIGGRAVTRHAI